MESLVELADVMTGCLLGGTIIGQMLAVVVVIAVVLVALFIAARLLDSRLTAPVLIVGLVVGTGLAVYAVGTSFAVFENDRGELHPQASRHARCKQTPEPGNEVRLGAQRLAVLLP
jgi:O-antigen ligase